MSAQRGEEVPAENRFWQAGNSLVLCKPVTLWTSECNLSVPINFNYISLNYCLSIKPAWFQVFCFHKRKTTTKQQKKLFWYTVWLCSFRNILFLEYFRPEFMDRKRRANSHWSLEESCTYTDSSLLIFCLFVLFFSLKVPLRKEITSKLFQNVCQLLQWGMWPTQGRKLPRSTHELSFPFCSCFL